MINWKEILEKNNKLSIMEQNKNKKEIIEAFRAMIKSKPTEEEFSYYLGGCVMFAEMFYILIQLK